MSTGNVTTLIVNLPEILDHPLGANAYSDDQVLTAISRAQLSQRMQQHRIRLEDAFADIAEDQIQDFRTLEDDEAVKVLRDMVETFIQDPLHCLTVPESTLHRLGPPNSGWIGVLHPLRESTTPPPVRDLEDVTRYYWYHLLCAETIPLLEVTVEPVRWTGG